MYFVPQCFQCYCRYNIVICTNKGKNREKTLFILDYIPSQTCVTDYEIEEKRKYNWVIISTGKPKFTVIAISKKIQALVPCYIWPSLLISECIHS